MLNSYSLSGSKFFPQPILDLKLAFISSYPPRRCGIATYTKDLCTGINNLNPYRLSEIIAMDDSLSEQIRYPWEVSHRIKQESWNDYQLALNYLNNSVIDMVSIQHEFGIFGGKDGKYIVKFAKKLKKPYVLTLHTVLSNPDARKKRIIQDLARKASAVFVMLPAAADILIQIYQIQAEKIIAISHGTPDYPFLAKSKIGQKIKSNDRIIMSSINLLSRGKGLENAIEAMPAILKKYPNFVYYIIGKTHPVVLSREGEKYRLKLKKIVKVLGLGKNVRFINRYVSLATLMKYLKKSDFYITPYKDLEQTSSGALAYGIAAGVLCLSTPYRYAKELLAGQRGYLVEPGVPKSISDAVMHALDNPKEIEQIRRRCYYLGRTMTWGHVAFRHIIIIEHLLKKSNRQVVYSVPKLSHLKALTTKIGLIEHTLGDILDFKEGYSSDDNARGLIVATINKKPMLAEKYLSYLLRSEVDGQIYCDSDSQGKMVGQPGLGDWFGRTFWAVAFSLRFSQSKKIRQRSEEMVIKMLPWCFKVQGVRTPSFILLGLCELKNLKWSKRVDQREDILNHLLTVILEEYKKHSSSDWYWLERKLSYDNCRVPQALLAVSQAFKKPEFKDLGLKMLDFILSQTFDALANYFRFVGCHGWFPKDGKKALYDEQPIEAGSTAQACALAYKLTGINYYKDMAFKSFSWFYGDNILRRPLYNERKGSVYDGITINGLNMNQGAESILEYLLASDACAGLPNNI